MASTASRYGAWKASPADLAALESWIAAAAQLRPSAMSRNEAYAHWANLYNALTLKVVPRRWRRGREAQCAAPTMPMTGR